MSSSGLATHQPSHFSLFKRSTPTTAQYHNMNTQDGSQVNVGSQAAQHALATLARILNIDQNTLKIALDSAFDLLPAAGGNPTLALHMSFGRMNLRIDGRILDEVIAAFRQTFRVLLVGNSKCDKANDHV